MKKRFLAILLLGLTFFSVSSAEVKEVRTQIGDNYVAYPELCGQASPEAEKAINEELMTAAQIGKHLLTLATLGERKLTVGYRVEMLNERLYSVLIDARGKMPNRREGQCWTACTWWLETGERVTLSDVFADEETAVSAMEEMALQSLTISEYVSCGDVTPFPENAFTVSETGLTFYYDGEQLQDTDGTAGSCHFFWCEIAEWLSEAFAPFAAEEKDPVKRAEMIRSCAEQGSLPGLDVRLGQPMTEIVDRYGLVRTPDVFPGGRYFEIREPVFRDIRLISDNMQSGWEHSELEGIQLLRGGVAGLVIGKSEREEITELLGEADETIPFPEGVASDYGLPAGNCDRYLIGKNVMRFYTDEEGVLRAVQLGR